jgi:hypothetical protein
MIQGRDGLYLPSLPDLYHCAVRKNKFVTLLTQSENAECYRKAVRQSQNSFIFFATELHNKSISRQNGNN